MRAVNCHMSLSYRPMQCSISPNLGTFIKLRCISKKGGVCLCQESLQKWYFTPKSDHYPQNWSIHSLPIVAFSHILSSNWAELGGKLSQLVQYPKWDLNTATHKMELTNSHVMAAPLSTGMMQYNKRVFIERIPMFRIGPDLRGCPDLRFERVSTAQAWSVEFGGGSCVAAPLQTREPF